ncbi:MAG: LTA synthase family protein [Acetivibrionales bacterium]
MKTFFTRIKSWLSNIFEDRTDVIVAVIVLFYVLTSALKISLFNHVIVPHADKWMFRFKFLTTLLVVIIVYPVLFRFRKRFLLITFYITQTLYIIISMSYFLYFHNYLHFDVFAANFYEGLVAVLIESTPKSPLLLIAFIDFPFFAYLAIAYQRVNRMRVKLRVPVNVIVAIALIITVWSQYGHYKEDKFITQIAKSKRIGESYIVQRYGTLANSIVAMTRYRTTQDYIDSIQYGRPLARQEETGDKPDIFIIQVESMESAIVRQIHDGSPVMPYLHSMTRRSVYYPYMLTYHFGGGTSDCEFSAINSVEPLVEYPAIKLTAYKAPNSFVKQLAKSSYRAYAFHGNIGIYYNRGIAFRSFGFDEFYDIDKMKLKDVGWGAPDDKVYEFALNKVKESERPVLSYVITMSSHGPFTNVSNYYNDDRFDNIDDKKLRNYYNSMAYVDKCIENYVRAIRENFDNAYIIIFGDHAPQVNNESFKEAYILIADKRYEFVPLFILTPDNKVHCEEQIVASLLDISPTILNFSGVEYNILSDGIDLLDPERAEPGKIPYRGLNWDRKELFRHASDAIGQGH